MAKSKGPTAKSSVCYGETRARLGVPGGPAGDLPTEPARDGFDETFPVFFWKTRDDTHKFSHSRGFHDNFFLSRGTFLGGGGWPWPRHFLLRRRKIQEKIDHSAVGAAVTIMEENIDLIFPLRRAAFLLLLLLHLSRRGPGHGKHLFTVRNFRKNTHTQKHANLNSQNLLPPGLEPAFNPTPSAVARERSAPRKHRSGTVPLFFRGHCSE